MDFYIGHLRIMWYPLRQPHGLWVGKGGFAFHFANLCVCFGSWDWHNVHYDLRGSWWESFTNVLRRPKWSSSLTNIDYTEGD